MREIRLYGSEGGEAKAFPTPYQRRSRDRTLFLHESIKWCLFFSGSLSLDSRFRENDKERGNYIERKVIHL